MKLTNFQIKLGWGVGIGSIICLWITFPFIFKTLLSFYTFPENFNEFGAFGDIYGSLNTLISSIALCAVAFSTWLQVTSLRETRKSNESQLLLAQKAHVAQIKESQYAIFTNMFQMLMSQKLTLQKDLCSNLKNYQSPQMIFLKMSKEFQSLIENKWTDISKVNLTEIDIKFSETANDLGQSDFFSDILYNYFFIYDSILYLIKTSSLEKEQKEIFYKIVSNSMDMYEQLTLLWFSAFTDRVSQNLVNSKILDFEFDKLFLPFCLKFHKRTHFNSQTYINAFKKLKKTPA
ncbi:hypothetical protein WH285_12395 [Acinetobacter johnsonii]|uniref:hypothetical protein n=1 Tax=Acinetobacter johnsonii TaxID=40214 RepID=UPI0030B4F72B